MFVLHLFTVLTLSISAFMPPAGTGGMEWKREGMAQCMYRCHMPMNNFFCFHPSVRLFHGFVFQTHVCVCYYYCCFVCNQDVKEEYREFAIRLVHRKRIAKEDRNEGRRVEKVIENRQKEEGVIVHQGVEGCRV